MTALKEIVAWLDQTLDVTRVRDVATNGLQVEGRPEVRRVVTGVSANLALIQAALDRDADLLIAHHGLIWGGLHKIVGPVRRRLAALLEADLSLAAYHLPLDLHPELGNNAGLARTLGLVDTQPFGLYKGQQIAIRGRLPQPQPLDALLQIVRDNVHPQPLVLAAGDRAVRSVAVCSGEAPELVEEALEAGCDLFVTGEAAEPLPALVEEGSIHVVAAGHHATERFGVRALAQAVAQEFGVAAEFIDIPNIL